MSHHCNTPSKYAPQMVFGGFRCSVCGQRWVNLPAGRYQAEWTAVGWWRWQWIGHGAAAVSIAIGVGIVGLMILLGWVPITP